MSGSVLDELAEPLRDAVAAVGGDGGPAAARPAVRSVAGRLRQRRRALAGQAVVGSPRAIAERILAGLDSPWIDTAEIAGPGFINLRVRPSWFGHVVGRVLDEGAAYGGGAVPHPQRLQVEFVSGNPTGPMTVATARNAAYGDALGRLFQLRRPQRRARYYFNDTGRQIELFGASLLARARGEEPPEDGYQGEYVAEIAASARLSPDAPVEQWARAGTDEMMARIRPRCERFRVGLRLVVSGALAARGRDGAAGDREGARGRSRVRAGRRGVAGQRGAGRRQGPRADPQQRRATYFAGDLAYIVSKLDRGFDAAVYVLGADHHGYIGRLKAAARALGYDPDRVDVQIYQLVSLKGGKMSKRAGRVVTLDDLLDAVGRRRRPLRAWCSARTTSRSSWTSTCWFSRTPRTRSTTASTPMPASRAILRNAGEPAKRARPAASWAPQPPEQELVKALAAFPDLVAEAADRRAPHRIIGHVQDTAKAFHQFYKQCRVIGAEPEIEAEPARPLPGDEAGHCDLARPGRRRGAGAHVRCPGLPPLLP